MGTVTVPLRAGMVLGGPPPATAVDGDPLIADLAAVFGSATGTFSFEPADPAATAAGLQVRFTLGEVALAYARAVSAPGAKAAAWAGPIHSLTVSPDIDAIRRDLRLSGVEWKLLFRINGKRSVDDLRESMRLPAEEFDHALLAVLMVRAALPGPQVASAGHSVGSASTVPRLPVISAERSAPSTSSILPDDDPNDVSTLTRAVAVKIPDDHPLAIPIPGASAPPSPSETVKTISVLVIDDSRTVQAMVKMALQPLGLALTMADSGEQALELARANAPDLVILDVIMPGMDGFKCCGELRKLLAPAKPPILMLTSKDGTFDSLKARIAGATAYLNKPFEPDELRDTVRGHMDEIRKAG